MKNIKSLFIVGLAAIALSGCGQPASTGDEGIKGINANDPTLPVFNVTIKSLAIDEPTKYLMADDFEGYQINVSYQPRIANLVDIQFESSDTKVATVSPTGLVLPAENTSGGTSVITIKDSYTNIKTILKVYVGESISNTQGRNIANQIVEVQEDESFVHPTKVHCIESFDRQTLKNGYLSARNKFWQVMDISRDDAFVRIYSDDHESFVEDGALESSSTEWVFVTNEFFQTYIYHTIGTKKNYLRIDSSSFIGVEDGRFLSVCKILDNLFTSGSGIVTSTLEDAVGTDVLTYARQGKNFGSSGKDGNVSFLLHQSQQKAIVAIGDERNMGIPAGTEYSIDLDIRWSFDSYYCMNEELIQTMKYLREGNSMQEVYYVNYDYDLVNVDLTVPDKTSYQEVNDIFEL